MSNILNVLDNAIKNQNDKTLLLAQDKEYSYGDFNLLIKSIMKKVLASSYKRGDTVAVIIEEYDYFFASIFALWRLGAVAVPLNASLKIGDLQMLVEKSKSSLLLAADNFCENITLDNKIKVSDIDTSDTIITEEYKPLEMDETAVIMFTSGTTGIPKGVVQSLYAQSENATLTCEKLGLGKDDRVFINTPPYFTSGMSHFLTLINAGGSLVGYKGFVFGSDLLTMMVEKGSTGFGGAPAHLIRVVETMEEPFESTQINFWMSSGDHLPLSAINKAERFLPNVRLFNVYGLTEVSGRFCILMPEFAKERNGSVGKPIGDMKAAIIDSDGNEAARGEIGEINVNGPLLMKEYLDAPDITKKAIGPYGFRTGDFGYMDSDGFVYVEGRKDDIFKRGGEKVSTNKIKQAMLSLGIFKDVAVIAMDDELMGKTPVACVVMKEDNKFSKFKILKMLKNKLVNTHIPSNVIELSEIPRTGSGKMKMKELKALLENL